MTYEEFKTDVTESIKNYLTDEFKDYEITFQTVAKAEGVYEGMIIAPKEKGVDGPTVNPVLNLTSAYERLCNGTSMNTILTDFANIRMNATLPSFNKMDLLKYDKVKDKLFPRLVNTASSLEYLRNRPHTDVLDMSVVYTVILNEDSNGCATVTVTDDLMKAWDVDKVDVVNRAMTNLAEQKYTFCPLTDLLFGIKRDVDIEDMDLDEDEMPVFCLSNEAKHLGACMAINPMVMNKIVDKFGDVLVLPSSIHEVLIIPTSAGMANVARLKDMVTSINNDTVSPSDRLSNNIYMYDRETETLVYAD